MKWGARIYGHVYGLGDPPWDEEAWNLFEAHAQKRVTILSYGQPCGEIAIGPLAICFEHLVIPLVTVMCEGTSIADIAAGRADAKLDAMGRSLATHTGSPVLRFAHEFNGTWYAGDGKAYGAYQPATYAKAFRRVYLRVKRLAPRVRLCWCPNVIGGPTVADPGPYWPGAAYVDLMGVDGYNQNGAVDNDVFGPTVDRLRQIGAKPIWICETGCIEGPGKRHWLERFLLRDIRVLGINGLVYFNGDPVENGIRRTWPIESSVDATLGFRQGIGSSRYEGEPL